MECIQRMSTWHHSPPCLISFHPFLDLIFPSGYSKLDSYSYLIPVRMVTDRSPYASALLAYTCIPLNSAGVENTPMSFWILLELRTTKHLFGHTTFLGSSVLWSWQFSPRKGMRNKGEKWSLLQGQPPGLWRSKDRWASSQLPCAHWFLMASHVVLGYISTLLQRFL